MVFLNPSVLLGLLAASIPILIHFLNFRKLKKVEFSTLSFLRELQKSKIKKIKIKQWLLLLLRTLIIIFLVLTFARPTLESTSVINTNSAAKSTNIFILDNSFSMLAINDDGSNFNRSKQIIKNIISEMQNEDEFFFIIGNDSIRQTLDKEMALKILDESEISGNIFNLNKSVNLAVNILQESQNINKQIFLFSDFQKYMFSTKDDSISIKLINDKIKLYAFKISTDKNTNTSISNLKLLNSIIEFNKPLKFKALVHNYSNVIQNNLIASLFINNKRVAQQNITINGNEKKSVIFETTLSKTGLIEVYAQIDNDDILTDNKCFTSFYVSDKIKVLLLYDNLANINFIDAALLTLTKTSRIEVTKKNCKNYSSGNGSEFDLIILIGGNNLVDIKDLQTNIITGNKLIYFPNKNITVSQLNTLQKYLGLPKAQKIIITDISKNNYAQIDFIDLTHPVFSNLFSSKKTNKIDSPNFYKYIKFNGANNIKPIMRLSDNSIFSGEYEFGKGKIIFFNSAINLSWNNFPIKSLFAPLINRLITYLTSKNGTAKSYSVKENIPIKLTNSFHPQLKIVSPIGTEFINLGKNIANIFNYKNTNSSGIYKFYSQNKLVAFGSVNVESKESDLISVSSDELNNYFLKSFKNNYSLLKPNEDFISKIREARFGSELWKLFLSIALLLAIAEMFLSRSSKKDWLFSKEKISP